MAEIGKLELALHPTQELALNCPATEIVFGGAAGGGKLLPLDTRIPTPQGWTTMGQLKVGQSLFDERGQICQVTQLFDIEPEPELYRLTFDDGSTIDACKDHQWLTFSVSELDALSKCTPKYRHARRATRPSKVSGNKSEAFTQSLIQRNIARRKETYDKPKGSVRTTQEIVATLRIKSGRTNHAIPVAKPLQLQSDYLVVPPYVLGAWLGDGTSAGSGFTGIDPEICDEIKKAGFEMSHSSNGRSHYIKKLAWRLKNLLVINNKHIPPEYLRAHRNDRLALLQGLMDTDGTVTHSGSAEFCTTSIRLAKRTYELITSLGWKTNMREGKAKLYGKDCGPKWTLKFTPTEKVFRLPRKANKQKLATRRTTAFRYIVKAEQIPSRPGRCIAVNSASRLFLAGDAMIPTHNSAVMRAASVHFCMQIPGLQAYLFRRNRIDLIKNHFQSSWSYRDILAPLIASGHARIVLSANQIKFWNGSVIHLCFWQCDKDRDRYQGADIHLLLIDELTHFHEQEYRFLRGRLRLGGLKIPSHVKAQFPRVLCGTNPGGVGHVWVKEGWVDRGEFVVKKMPVEEGGMTRCFIPSRTADNPTLDADYRDKLAGLGDPLLVRAMLDGDWEIVAGSMFGSVWRKHLHVCQPFPIPFDWKIWRGADDGYAAPHAAVWITMDPATGTHYVIDELYKANMLPEEVAQRTKAIDARITRAGPNGPVANTEPISGILDSAAFSNTGTQSNLPRGQSMNALGLRYKPCIKWPGCRASYVQHMHRLLAPNPRHPDPARPGEFLPGIRFFAHCIESLKRIPNLPRDPRDPETIDDAADDHLFDATVYGLMWKQNEFRRATKTGL
jgi:hypothetical protein